MMTHEQRMADQRARRQRDGNIYTIRYERTKSGKLMRIYRNMQSRVEGVQHLKAHLYEGKELLSREDFYAWAADCPDFERLFDAWAESGYLRRLAPSVDRVDSRRGYSTDNMEWVTHSENSRRGAVNRHGKARAA